ncbi:hypothetical protein CEV33_4918 [Brucella grignonensis]|uniref:Uncharacterized protein n=1 Tax=Brucella grignonensis TaxID=94627 RepID=A0A256FSG1_9HYPH|nr:hypothetical protein CEV33_4918 [Brucella grignonensis]
MLLAARLRAVPTLAFVAQQLQEELHRVVFFTEMMLHGLATRAYAPPSAGQADVPKQGRLDRHGIKPGHVFRGIHPFDVKLVGLHDHRKRIALFEYGV